MGLLNGDEIDALASVIRFCLGLIASVIRFCLGLIMTVVAFASFIRDEDGTKGLLLLGVASLLFKDAER